MEEHERISPHTLMDRISTIEAPQPRRPLKRKLFEVEGTDVAKHSRSCLSPPLMSSRSDSFLLKMTTNPTRQTCPPKRCDDDMAMDVLTMSRSPSIPLPSSPSISPYSSISNPTRADTPRTQVSYAPRSSCVEKPNYRTTLAWNNVHIDPPEISATVVAYASSIIKAERNSPGLSDAEARAASTRMRFLQQAADEVAVKDAYLQYKIIPYPDMLPEGVIRGADLPFDTTALPHAPFAPPLACPKPDHHYSFSTESFSVEQGVKQTTGVLRPYSTPSSSGHWPFLTIEFKSQPKGGTIWVAENQVATSGAQLTCSVEKLLSMSDKQHDQIDSISFGCTTDAKNVAFWVNYCEEMTQVGPGGRKLCIVEVQQFSMRDAESVVACRNAFRNVLGWSIKERLPMILKALDRISMNDIRAQSKEQRLHDADSESSTSKRSRNI